MLGTLSDELLAQLTDDGGEENEVRLGDSLTVFDDLPEAVKAAAVPSRIALFWIAGLSALGVLLPLLTIGAAAAANLPVEARMVLPAIALILPFLAIYVATAIPVLIDRKFAPKAASRSLSVYFLGGSPFTRRRLVLAPRSIFLLSGGQLIGRIPTDAVATVGVDVRQAGAVLVVALEDGVFLPLMLTGRVGGPMSARWSVEGLLGIGKFKAALLADLDRCGVPFALTDWTGRQ